MSKGRAPKTLIFHIGDHKTGTTTIQNALASGAIKVNGEPVFYPAQLNHNYLMGFVRAHKEGESLPARLEKKLGFADLAREIKATSSRCCVISGEVFENAPPKVFHDIVETYFRDAADEIKIVAYVRPHIQRVVSSFGEQMKIGWFTDTLDAFCVHNLQQRRFHYAARFERWRNFFGDALVVRPMVRSKLHKGSVLDDFVQASFGSVPYEISNFPDENGALSLQQFMVLKHVQSKLQGRSAWLRHSFGWELARRLRGEGNQADMSGEKIRLHRSLCERLVEAYEEDAILMDDNFFDGQPVMHEALKGSLSGCVEQPQSVDPVDYFSQSELNSYAALAEIIEDMLGVRHQWPAYFHRHRIQDVENFRAAAGLTGDTP